MPTAAAAAAARTERAGLYRPARPVLAGLVGVAAAAVTAAGVGQGDAGADTWSVLRGVVVALYALVGAYTWWRRPASRFGLLLADAGLLFAVGSLSASSDAWAHTFGRVVFAGFVVYFAYVLLAFPHGTLGSQRDRRALGALAAATAAAWAVALPLVQELPAAGPLVDCVGRCPGNALQVVEAPARLSSALGLAVNAVTAAVLLLVVASLLERARSPRRLRRRLVVPLFLSACALTTTYALYTVLRQAGAESHLEALRGLGAAAAMAIPTAVLVGQVRGRVFAARSLGRLVVRVGGALLHDEALDAGATTVQGLAATSLLLLENARLVEEVSASRARIVAATEQERLRLERDLHDGVQQRLFLMQLRLELARERAGDPELARELAELGEHAVAAVQEVRAVAHGIYPTVLRERGLADALRAAARTAPVPATIEADGVGRCDPGVELAVYYCVLEALQNAAKHAGASARVAVTLARAGDGLEFTVADDGDGFDPGTHTDGMGLVSMHDRIRTLGGELEILTTRGLGTTVRGAVPDCDGRREP